ncbi:winged helix-turn-helix transcriptional regulator [Chryseobacterium formosus]|uniref:Winged helix-turn-helix transcriptional regulator n=1 Tax=Chryseobacterium formosus TaxID=1537363 RepID=A0ABT3XTC9_9FLAO|nr:winged helix-turn-helix transcriptional regulator [Chryseobacterium formosus]MCX8524622.1 winged helix-turn-helix transcriptional regulator [Chryseobacterium formosus]
MQYKKVFEHKKRGFEHMLGIIIIKKVENGYPVTIEYELLPYSCTLEEVVAAMTKWGMQHREKVKAEMSFGKSEK